MELNLSFLVSGENDLQKAGHIILFWKKGSVLTHGWLKRIHLPRKLYTASKKA